jgi:mono/diheme cytochrome c family protein
MIVNRAGSCTDIIQINLKKEVCMRKIFLFMLSLSIALLPLTALAEKANTIDELMAPYDSSKCTDCHEEIHENWAKSWHAKTVTDPRTLRTFRTFILSGVDKLPEVKRTILRDMCLMCHVPAAMNASDELAAQIADLVVTAADDKDASKREAATKELSKLTINCMTCHGMKTPGGLGASGLTANTLYGPGDATDIPHKDEFGFDTVKSDNMKKSEFCAPCHHGCPPGMTSKECPTQWTVYQEHYLAHGETKTCQDCHMAGEDGASHRFPGIYEKEFAGTAIDIKLDATPTVSYNHLANTKVPAITMNVQVKNKGAHDMPHG